MKTHRDLDIKQFRKPNMNCQVMITSYSLFWEFIKNQIIKMSIYPVSKFLSQLWIPILDEHMQKWNEGSIFFYLLAPPRKVYHASPPPKTSVYYVLLDLVLCSRGNLCQCLQALLGITGHQGCNPHPGTTNPWLQRPEGMFSPVPAGS